MSQKAIPQQIGRYDVIRSLGKGAMGQVWLAKDPILSREVALKVLRNDLELEEAALTSLRTRIRQEAQAAAQVSHPGIVALFDLGTDEQYGHFIVSENVIGPTLEAALIKGRLTRNGVARLAETLGEALSRAHDLGVIHRDIKPGNIILTSEGAKITDFGIARLPDSVLTKAGAQLGTPAYIAPEVIDSSKYSPASDQFAFAATLYEALSGVRAFPGVTAVEVARSIQRLNIAPFSKELGLPDQLDDVFSKAMSREPSQRFSSAQEFGITLSALLSETRESSHTLRESQVHPLLPHRPQRWKSAGYMTLVFLLGAISALLLNSYKERSPLDTTTTKVESIPVIQLGSWKKKE